MPKEELRFRLAALEHIVAMTNYREADISCLTSLLKLKEDSRVLNFKWDCNGKEPYYSARYFTVTLKSPMENDAVKKMLSGYGLKSKNVEHSYDVSSSNSREASFYLKILPAVEKSEKVKKERKSHKNTAKLSESYSTSDESIMFLSDGALNLRRR